MRVSQCFSGATAVTKGLYGDYFLAMNECILLVKQDGSEKELINLKNRILDLVVIDTHIYGVGDNGLFIRSKNYGLTWEFSQLPTSGSIWSICADQYGTVVTHGNHVLFLSRDFGETWKTLYPFHSLTGSKPSIRSILLENNFVWVGTKVHPVHGGIWKVDLQRFETTHIKKDTRMIASIIKHNHYFVLATGTCKGYKGAIEYCHTDKANSLHNEWETCVSDCKERCYLDLSESNGFLYTTTTQDENGVGKVSRVYLDEKRIEPLAIIGGHGWRVSNHEDNFLVAGLYTSLYSKSQFQQIYAH